MKFSDRGEIGIEVHRSELGNGQSGIEFLVTDTGAGLTGDQRIGLFVPFFQADSAATRKFGGTGLGLALSRRLARQLGGDVALLDIPPVNGCTFRITIADMGPPSVKITGESTPAASHEAAKQGRARTIFAEKVLIVATAMALLTASVASILPARAAGQLTPIDVIRQGG